jgi:hypothetical protein
MPHLTHFKVPCPEHINSQILQLVVDNLTDISMVGIAPSNPLYNVYQYAVGYEVHLYLEALGGGKGIAVELIVATDEDDPEKVIGFLLYLRMRRGLHGRRRRPPSPRCGARHAAPNDWSLSARRTDLHRGQGAVV